MITAPVYTRRRRSGAEHPVELRFVDMLLIVIATLMVVAIVLSVISAISGGGRPDVAPRVTTRSAPAAVEGQPYRLTLAVQGGDGHYSWRTAKGGLPDGMRLAVDGTVRGTPAHKGTARFAVRVTDGTGRSADSADLALTVRPAGAGEKQRVRPRVETPVTLLDDAVAGREYRHAFQAGAGTPPYRWSVKGDPPEGLEFAADGTLAGRPEAGGSTFTVLLTDGSGETARQKVRMAVADAPESLFWRALGWLRTGVRWFGYFLVASYVAVLILGRGPDAGSPGLVGRLRARQQGRGA
ncbi:putative Ig domain-containing protein [Streptomyces sp. NPDC048172]|uniref:putative Ig domain-containing protein n=1 Tax=Streptomyces sp. NPDC048172 TaxID=3365505 RepID=UPI0037207F0D